MIFYFLIPFLISVTSIPFLIYFSRKKNIMDFAGGDDLKIHKEPISFFGGVAIFIGSVLSFFVFGFWDIKFFLIIFGCATMFFLGLWDDFKWKHVSRRKPYVKFVFLVLCSLTTSLLLYFSGIKFYMFPFLAFFYIFVLINAVNYQDGIDGQAGILFLISMVGFYILSLISGNSFALQICTIFLGAVAGFIVYNFPPAKIFMGDSGAYLLGFVLAMMAIFFSRNVAGHIFILGLPLFDGVYINLKRLLMGRSIFLGDRQHFYDKMIDRGFSVRKTVIVSAALQVVFVAAGILIYIYV